MIISLDTSAVNRLHDDPEREALITGLVAGGRVYVTALNVIEACGTPERPRRESLLRLEKRLARDFHPLEIPLKMLENLAIAHSRSQVCAMVTIGDDVAGIWDILNDPSRADEEIRKGIISWQQSLEEPFKRSHGEARLRFQELFEREGAERPRSGADLIRSICRLDQPLTDHVTPMYKKFTGTDISNAEVRQFFNERPEWVLYFLGWAYSMHQRAIRRRGYGQRGKPGTVDLWCAVYLPHCDCFVTHDVGQRRALRVLNVFNPRLTKIISYDELRQRLLVRGLFLR
jgi:hypothetical protein